MEPGKLIRIENVSIHASAREATNIRREDAMEYNYVSIHASAREATRPLMPSVRGIIGFNPRLRTGGDGHRCLVLIS